jgi:hypothetical protein
MILKCSLVHYGMIMLMIMIFSSWKIFFHWRFTWVKCFFNHLSKIRWSFHFKKNEKPLTSKGFKKPLLNYWCTFRQMHNYDSISNSWFLWRFLILRPTSIGRRKACEEGQEIMVIWLSFESWYESVNLVGLTMKITSSFLYTKLIRQFSFESQIITYG